MVLTINEFSNYFNWADAEIKYLQMVGNSIVMDVDFVTYKQTKRCKLKDNHISMRTHLTFQNVSVFTDDYFSPLEKMLYRFSSPYICLNNDFNEKGEFIIDDCVRIKCDSVEVLELPHQPIKD